MENDPVNQGMQIRAILRLRNDAMLMAREEHGWTQANVADMAGEDLGQGHISMMERMDFDFPKTWERVQAVADVLGLEPVEIMPPDMARKIIPSTFIRKTVCDIKLLDDMMHRFQGRFMLPSPEATAQGVELGEAVEGFVASMPRRQAAVLHLRSEGRTFSEIGDKLQLSKERIRQIEMSARRKLRRFLHLRQQGEQRQESAMHEATRFTKEWEESQST